MNTQSDSRAFDRLSFAQLAGLFGLLYYFQSIVDPTDGLMAQPVRSLLMRWGQTATEIGTFSALLALPWAIKPLYGLISDFLPLFGYRRKSYLILTSAVSASALLALSTMPLGPSDTWLLLAVLLVPTVGTAFGDVTIDALMITLGQPRSWTGQLQSVMWTAAFAATALAGVLGGYLSEYRLEQRTFLICGCACLASFVLSCLAHDQRSTSPRERWRENAQLLRAAWGMPALQATAVFLFLWNFNPFSTSVLHLHMVRVLRFSEQFYGDTLAITAIASMFGTLLYGLVRSRIPFRWLLHVSIVLGILSTAAYWGLREELPAQIVSAATGFITAVALLIQLDLAAQVCPSAIAGTVFAVLMSLVNLSASLSTWLGGHAYDLLGEHYGNHVAFDVLVGIGSLMTALCWLVMPRLLRGLEVARVANLPPVPPAQE